MVTLTPIQSEKPQYLYLEHTPYACKSSLPPCLAGSPLLHPDLWQQDLLHESFGQSLQVTAKAIKNL